LEDGAAKERGVWELDRQHFESTQSGRYKRVEGLGTA